MRLARFAKNSGNGEQNVVVVNGESSGLECFINFDQKLGSVHVPRFVR